MKRFIFFFIAAAAVIFFTAKGGQAPKSQNPQIYYADRRLYSLVAAEYEPKHQNPKKQAEEILSALSERKSRDIVTFLEDTPSVSLKNGLATVNLSSHLKEKITRNFETEQLFVYQIVNSLTSIEGIERVCFTIDGKSCQDFLGFLNMREIFVPDYFI